MNYLKTIAAFTFGAIAGISVFKGLGYAILGDWASVTFSAISFVLVCAIAILVLAKIDRTTNKIDAENTAKA